MNLNKQCQIHKIINPKQQNKFILRVSLILALLLLVTPILFAQIKSPKEIERDLKQAYQKILSARFEEDDYYFEKVDSLNVKFRDMLSEYTSLYPETLVYPFDSLKESKIDIVNSEDGLLRIYSWDTWAGGTFHFFENVFQYRSEGKVFSKVYFDIPSNDQVIYIPFYSQIFSLKTKNKIYYLAINNGIYSAKDASQSIQIFAIENNEINDRVELIQTKEGMVNSIGVMFDFFSIVNRQERPFQLIKYDPKSKIIYIPIVLDDGKVTDQYNVYQFNGKYFELILIQVNSDLKKKLSKL